MESSVGPDNSIGSNSCSKASSEDNVSDGCNVRIPIVGFEVMDERARFTVFKLRIENEKVGDSWLVFRRYTDFVRLHNKLKEEFPTLNIPLPPKRWLRDNFEPAFLEDRMKGLQAFVDSILLLQPNLTEYSTVREFFCLDEPPVYPENAEESRAMYGTVEENVIHLKQQLSSKDLEIEILKAELALITNQRDNLLKATKSCRYCSQRISFIATENHSETSNINSFSHLGKPSPAVPFTTRVSSTSDRSTSSSLASNEKSRQNSPTTVPTKECSSPALNDNFQSVLVGDTSSNSTL
ncbi:unnamed protein product [Allacma fusca]|uniref:PX domain-containing protein n=1 Tax=Allacma fusca TaxID=39272 RepID=A0A8J2KDH2_9HEXA|nr:unnamed protein product [Allacma fusca]